MPAEIQQRTIESWEMSSKVRLNFTIDVFAGFAELIN